MTGSVTVVDHCKLGIELTQVGLNPNFGFRFLHPWEKEKVEPSVQRKVGSFECLS